MGEPASSSELIRYFWPWIWLALDGKHSVVCADQVLCHLVRVVLFLVTSARALWEHLLGYLGLDEENSFTHSDLAVGNAKNIGVGKFHLLCPILFILYLF